MKYRTLKVKYIAALAGSVTLAAWGTLGWAQRPGPDLADASLEELGRIQILTASEHSQDVRDAPSSVTVVTGDEIQRFGYRTLADILRHVREFYVSYDRDYSYLGVRGFGRPGDYNTRVLLLIDGHRINDNIFDQAMLGTEFPLDVDLIERVEVIRGPGSSLYGSNAFFAVINVITRKASELAGWQISFEPASYNTYKARTSYGGKWKGADVLLSGSWSDSSGQTLYFPEYDSPDTSNGIAHKLDFDRYRDFFVSVQEGAFSLRALTGLRNKGIPTAPFGATFDDPRTQNVDQHQFVDLGYLATHRGWEIGLRTYYDRYAYDGHWPFPEGELNIDYARGQMWGTELRFSRSVCGRHRLTFGTELRDNFQQDQRNYDTTPVPVVYVDSRRTSWLWAGYFQDEFSITPKLMLNAGARLDHYSQTDSATNPRLGLIYRPSEKTSLKALYGTAFRAPNVFEQFYGSDSPNLSGYQTNPALGAEGINNTEIVWEQDFSQHIRFSTNVFRNNTHGLISERENPSTGMLVYVNADKSRSTGVGAELGGSSDRGLGGSLAYSYSDTRDPRTGQMLVNSPRNLGKLKFSAPVVGQSMFAGFDLQYEGSRMTLAGNQIPGFPLANVTLFGRTFKNGLEISGSVYNLLDRSYLDVAPPEDKADALHQDGRSVRVKITWHIMGNR